MAPSSQEILEGFRRAHGKDIDLTLRSAYTDLLARLDHPEQKLPPAILVAGTNGKGSTCAFLRAMVEATGRTVHVYTSPDLITFHERIRVAGQLITEEELVAILQEAEALADHGGISLFEAQTTAALVAFARHKADLAILEIGLGGRLDATNIVPHPVASVITRLSFDHRDFLGDSMEQIAREKAGIMRCATPCFTAPQPSREAAGTLIEEAGRIGTQLHLGTRDWSVHETGPDTFRFESAARRIDNLPRPALIGDHQLVNAGLAIASLQALPFTVSDEAVREGLVKVEWLGRLQQLLNGSLVDAFGAENDLWVDGGHNDSAGEVLARQAAKWQTKDGRPLDLVFGMLTTKVPEEFLAQLLPFVRNIKTITFPSDIPAFSAADLADRVQRTGHKAVEPCNAGLRAALDTLATANGDKPARTLICGSLHVAGLALRENGA